MSFFKNLEHNIEQAVKKDMKKILKETGNEKIYAVALVADSDCITLYLAVNTYEFMEKHDKEYLIDMDLSEEDIKNLKEGSASLTQWLPDEWGYSDDDNSELAKISELLYENSESDEYDDKEYEENQKLFFETVTSAFKHLIEEKVFGEYSEKITYFISMSDDDRAEAIENNSAKLLNSPNIYETFLNRYIL
ncbi:DUF4303 domain-containing protein [Lachnospiraceae bacterium 48-33]